jgi:hypothetical protein
MNMQLFFIVVALCLCVRCLDCGVQGQVRECGFEAEGCYDVDLRVHLEPRRLRRSEARSGDDYGRRHWANERWQLDSSDEPQAAQSGRPYWRRWPSVR